MRWAIVPVSVAFALAAGCRRSGQPGQPPDGAAQPAAPPRPVAPSPPSRSSAQASPTPLPDVPTEWCLEGWRGLDEGICYLVPEEVNGSGSRRLLIYLAGIVPPKAGSPQQSKVERVVAAAAKRAGVVALLPRGRRGIGPADAKDWWAWPTSPADYARLAPSLVEELLEARAKLETALGRFDRTYLAGSSSGAYFLAALALSGAVAMDGYAAASGGAATLSTRPSSPPRPVPFYVGYGTGDPTNGGPKALAARLARDGWPLRVGEHPGGHGAREVYLDEAFAFFRAAERDGG